MRITWIIMRNTYPDERKYQYKIIKYQYVVSYLIFNTTDRVSQIISSELFFAAISGIRLIIYYFHRN